MDNVTHVLAGLFVAEIAGRLRARRSEPSPEWIRAGYFCSALANNLPDLDFLCAPIVPGKLGYLLHHRGYTHTLAIGLVLGLVPLAVVHIWENRRAFRFSLSERRALVWLSMLGPPLHLAMDFTNNYGVHPFWPVDARWFYGDALFIVEPSLWVFMLPPLLFATRARLGKLLLASLLVLNAILPWVARVFVPNGVAIGLALASVASIILFFTLSRARAALLALLGLLGVVATFLVARHIARTRMTAALDRAFPGEQLLDLAGNPFPANPLCWAFTLAMVRPDGNYVLRRARLSLAPNLVAAESCGQVQTSFTAPFESISASRTPELLLDQQLVRPIAELRARAENCETRAFLRFARLPFWRDTSPTEVIVGDLRFDRGPSLDFDEFVINREHPTCPKYVPAWIPPRADLLGER